MKPDSWYYFFISLNLDAGKLYSNIFDPSVANDTADLMSGEVVDQEFSNNQLRSLVDLTKTDSVLLFGGDSHTQFLSACGKISRGTFAADLYFTNEAKFYFRYGFQRNPVAVLLLDYL